ncbi:MAG: hypothetical protein E3K40_15900 [Candidatus Brocadia sp.]|nr:hypothetical protein [Candidatus Brocadia sp.]
MKSTKKPKNMPHSPGTWIDEIAEAYYDAYEVKPFGVFVGQKITGKDLFHITPSLCLKFRGIERTEANVDRATEAMLSSYAATESQNEGIFADPHLAFSFGYLASHYGVGLLTEDEVREIMVYLEDNHIALKKTVNKKIKKKND